MSPSAQSPQAILDRLVAFDTVSRNANRALIDWIADYLAVHGVTARLVPNEDGGKANLFATVGPDRDGGVMLSGHTDVVPVDGQDWATDPFTVTEKDGRLYGRGTADMKGFIALVLALIPEMNAAGLQTPIHLAFSYDEEIGCIGVPSLIAKLAKAFPMPALAIVGEPTSMKLVNAQKGIMALRTTVTGFEQHSSRTHAGVNAVAHAADIIAHLNVLARRFVADGPFDQSFEPPHTTVNIGQISGGTAINITARHCEFIWEFRPIPGVDPDAVLASVERHIADSILPEMRAKFAGADIVTEVFARSPPLLPEEGSPAEALVRRLTGANSTDTASFASEAGLFQEVGIPTVLCGPGDIAQAHQPNEFIALDQMAAGEAFLRKLIAWAADKPEW
jgi:acetylornithine deacetylase